MTPDEAALAREVTEMRGILTGKIVTEGLRTAMVDAEVLQANAFGWCDEKWPVVARLVREFGEWEVCS